jgi:hypothetical protein
LTDRELLLALGERACFDGLHRGRVGTH